MPGMQAATIRQALRSAEEIFNVLGSAFADTRIYPADHPRRGSAVTGLRDLIDRFFTNHEIFRQLTFSVSDGKVEFQGIPLSQLGNHGERLRAILEDIEREAFVILPGISRGDISGILRVFARFSRMTPAETPETIVDEVMGAGDETRHFRFVSRVAREDFSTLGDDQVWSASDSASCTDVEIPEIRASAATFRSVLKTYRSLLSGLEEGRALDYSTLTRATDEVVNIFAKGENTVTPAAYKTYFDDFTFHHSVNVSVIVTTVAVAITKNEELLRRITLAALLHDVGKTKVPVEILHKPGKLSPAEFEQLKSHPVTGAEILMGVEDIDPLCIAVAFTHHMHYGPRAYPKTARAFRLNWVTRLISVVDVYEALIAVRPYKNGFSSRKAFEIMLSMPGLQDRKPMIRLLYDRIGPYPVGTFIELTSGARAVVVAQNPGSPATPRVKVLTDSELNPLSDPLSVDLASQTGKPLEIRRTILLKEQTDDPLTGEAATEPDDILGSPPSDDFTLMTREG